MKHRNALIAATCVFTLLVTGGLLASNMGFKLVYDLQGPGAGAQNGTNTLGLPYNRQPTLVHAGDLIDSIEASGEAGPVVQVARYEKSLDGLETYTGAAGVPFDLQDGEGYRVQVTSDFTYVMAGSHNPGLVIQLDGPGAGAQNGTNVWSYPYHSTAENAEDLMNEIDTAAGSAVTIQVARYVKSLDGLESYSGAAGTPFGLVAGEAYRIQVSSDVAWVPSHY